MGHQYTPKSNRNDEVHVLMVSFALQSHINPLLRFGKRLVSKGLHVTLAVTINGRDLMFRSTDSAATTTTVSGVNIEFFDDGFPSDYPRMGANLDHYVDMLSQYGTVGLKSLIQTRPGPKPTCIVVNPFVSWAADVADDLNIPRALLWIQPSIMFDIYHHFYNNIYEFPLTEDATEKTVKLPGLPPLTREDLPSFILPTNTYHSFPKLLTKVFQSLKSYKWVMINSFYDLEKASIDAMNDICGPIDAVGPLVPPSLLGQSEELDIGVDMFKADDRCNEWLDKQSQNSVVYVSFGSLTVLQAEQVNNIQTALVNLKRPFLWVVKSGDSKNGGVSSNFLEETKDYGLVVPWCIQTKVLAHPSVACFVTHCGWNSTIETVVAGVPMIGCPQWTDQPTNAKLVADILKVGIRAEVAENGMVKSDELEKRLHEILNGPRATEIRSGAAEVAENGMVKSDELEKRLHEILNGPRATEIRSGAAEMKRLGAEAVVEGGSSDRNIQKFVNEIVAEKVKGGVK